MDNIYRKIGDRVFPQTPKMQADGINQQQPEGLLGISLWTA